jgi:hypothetical protein
MSTSHLIALTPPPLPPPPPNTHTQYPPQAPISCILLLLSTPQPPTHHHDDGEYDGRGREGRRREGGSGRARWHAQGPPRQRQDGGGGRAAHRGGSRGIRARAADDGAGGLHQALRLVHAPPPQTVEGGRPVRAVCVERVWPIQHPLYDPLSPLIHSSTEAFTHHYTTPTTTASP